MDPKQIEEVLDQIGYDYSPYSGRFMYGKECPAVECDDLTEMFKMFVEASSNSYDTALRMARTARYDSLGRGYIVYWPDATYPEETEAA